MREFERYDPIVITVYFLSLCGVLMFANYPFFVLSAFIGMLLYMAVNKVKKCGLYLSYLLLFLLFTLINPLMSHNGKTVIFFINNMQITLEAVIYGALMGGVIVSVLYVLSVFSRIMTRDKLLYVFGVLSPKLALVLSMSIRYVSLLRDRAREIKNTQTALGLYSDDNIIAKWRGDIRIFSILITWALENGIITADSMESRGYGRKKRTHYSEHRFKIRDAFMLLLICVLLALTLLGCIKGSVRFNIYPEIKFEKVDIYTYISCISFFVLCLIPSINNVKERVRWHFLKSKI